MSLEFEGGEVIDIFYAQLIAVFVRLSIIMRFIFLYQHTLSFQIPIHQKLHWSQLETSCMFMTRWAVEDGDVIHCCIVFIDYELVVR